MSTDDIQDNNHSQTHVQLDYGKVNVGNNLTTCTYIYIYIYIIIGTDNTQNDFYLQIHVHIYG
jgi:hypothetical protein